VAIAEEHRYGGTCVIRGCVPKKLFVYAAGYSHHAEDAAGFGWKIDATFDWATLRDRKDAEIDRLNGIYIKLLEKTGVEVLHGRATLVGPHEIRIGDRTVSAGHILIATGATPHFPDAHGIEHAVTSNEAFHLPKLPKHVVLVGGGYIGVEFAHIFAGLGCRVSLVHRREMVLRGFDYDLRDAVTHGLRAHHIDLHMSCEIRDIQKTEEGRFRVALTNEDVIETDLVMCATGRFPNTQGLGLEEVGVTLGQRDAVIVDEYSQTSVEHIYAVGDVTDRIALTPVAIREGQAFADTVFGNKPTPVDHAHIPSAVFSQPPAASVGLSETHAAELYDHIDIYRARFRPLKHTLSGRDEKVMMKLVVDTETQRVLGAHMVGDGAAENIQCLAIAIRMGATKADFDATTALHPTTAEEWVLMRTKSN
jgi:glutathione reductase (NADPH)